MTNPADITHASEHLAEHVAALDTDRRRTRRLVRRLAWASTVLGAGGIFAGIMAALAGASIDSDPVTFLIAAAALIVGAGLVAYNVAVLRRNPKSTDTTPSPVRAATAERP